MHSWVEIDSKALIQNYTFFCNLVGKQRLIPVLKANAYGHGMLQVYQCLKSTGLQAGLAVNYLCEAMELRKDGFSGRIIIVGPLLADELETSYTAGVEITIGCPILLAAWIRTTRRSKVHVKFDTGMGRQGFDPEKAPELAKTLKPWWHLVAGVSTHFANVEDVSDTSYACHQLERLRFAAKAFIREGFRVVTHAASSASSMLLKESHLDLCRVGISMYGLWASALTRVSWFKLHPAPLPLRPVLSWRTRVTRVRELGAGEFVGYGCTFRAPSRMQLAVLSVGYFEGYPRLIGEHPAWVLIRGRRCQILGRICMNMMMADTTHLTGLTPGEQATLIGKDGEEEITAETLARWSSTINYEAVTRINPILPRKITPG